MSFTSALQGIGNNIFGNPKKAMLIIPADTETVLDDAQLAMRTAGVLESAGMIGGAAEAQAKKAMQLAGFHILQVQYNPSTLSISANASPMPVQSMQSNMDTAIPNQNERPPSIVLSVELVFDAVNNKDAFMFEKFRLSTGDVVSAGAGIAKSFGGGYTVLPQTNGLIAAALRKNTKDVIFKWADMTFGGGITEASARYTMFSVSGKPIRSLVKLNISQKVEGTANNHYWNNAFEKCFGDQYVSQLSGGMDAGQYLNNLLNIGI